MPDPSLFLLLLPHLDSVDRRHLLFSCYSVAKDVEALWLPRIPTAAEKALLLDESLSSSTRTGDALLAASVLLYSLVRGIPIRACRSAQVARCYGHVRLASLLSKAHPAPRPLPTLPTLPTRVRIAALPR